MVDRSDVEINEIKKKLVRLGLLFAPSRLERRRRRWKLAKACGTLQRGSRERENRDVCLSLNVE